MSFWDAANSFGAREYWPSHGRKARSKDDIKKPFIETDPKRLDAASREEAEAKLRQRKSMLAALKKVQKDRDAKRRNTSKG